MSNYADILVHQHIIEPTNSVYRTYEWQGENHWPVFVSDNIRNELPWSFIDVERNLASSASLCIRKDALLPFGYAVIVKIKFVDVLRFIYYRTIATLMVWELAYIPSGCIPSWRHIGKKPK